MAGKGGRHTGEPSTQARSTWPTHIAPTRFLSLADNCTISLHSLVLPSLPLPQPTARTFSSSRAPPGVSTISLSHLPSSSSSLTLPFGRLSPFHVASRCHPISCTLFPLVYTWYPVASFVRASLSRYLFLAHYSPHTRARNLRTFSLCHTFGSPVNSRVLPRPPRSRLLPPWIRADALCPGSSSLLRPFLSLARVPRFFAHVEIRHPAPFIEDFVSDRLLFLRLHAVLVRLITSRTVYRSVKKQRLRDGID